jgi:hypothetical protein
MNTTERIVIMVDNEVGVLAGITGVLAQAGINVESINTQSAGDRGAVILTADDTDHALSVLNQAGYKAVSDDAVVVRLRDEPGSLAGVADRLKQAGVNIQNLHILTRQNGIALIALTTSDRAATEAAISGEEIL